jgi:hypothetical protein
MSDTFLVPALLVGGVVFASNMFRSVQPLSAIMWIDVLVNVTTFMATKYSLERLITMLGIEDGFFGWGADIVLEPVLDGVVLGLIYEFAFSQISKNLQQNMILTFNSGFAKGISVNILGNYLVNPLPKSVE